MGGGESCTHDHSAEAKQYQEQNERIDKLKTQAEEAEKRHANAMKEAQAEQREEIASMNRANKAAIDRISAHYEKIIAEMKANHEREVKVLKEEIATLKDQVEKLLADNKELRETVIELRGDLRTFMARADQFMSSQQRQPQFEQR